MGRNAAMLKTDKTKNILHSFFCNLLMYFVRSLFSEIACDFLFVCNPITINIFKIIKNKIWTGPKIILELTDKILNNCSFSSFKNVSVRIYFVVLDAILCISFHSVDNGGITLYTILKSKDKTMKIG